MPRLPHCNCLLHPNCRLFRDTRGIRRGRRGLGCGQGWLRWGCAWLLRSMSGFAPFFFYLSVCAKGGLFSARTGPFDFAQGRQSRRTCGGADCVRLRGKDGAPSSSFLQADFPVPICPLRVIGDFASTEAGSRRVDPSQRKTRSKNVRPGEKRSSAVRQGPPIHILYPCVIAQDPMIKI